MNASSPAPASRPPHVVLILCDQLRSDWLGFNGNPYVQTPNLDRLAQRGVVFDNLHVQTPVCMGSRACLLTGRYLRTIRMAGGSPLLDPRETTLPQWLQLHGYHTGMFGKLHLTPQQYTANELKQDAPINHPGPFLAPAGLPSFDPQPHQRDYGFNHCVGFEDALWGEYRAWLDQRDPQLGKRCRNGNSRYGELWQSDFPDTALTDVGLFDVPTELHPSMFIGASACDFFRSHHAQQPCFLHVSFVDPHHPWNPPRDAAARYDIDSLPLPRYRDTGDLPWPPDVLARRYFYPQLSDRHVRTARAYYGAMIDVIDKSVGRLLDTIEAAGEMDRTVFVFMSDHGEFLGDCSLWRKGALHYNHLIRVPSFISYPRAIPGARREPSLLQAIDLMPSLLGLLGLPAPAGVQGQDFSAAWRAGESAGRPHVWTESYRALWGPFIDCLTVRTERWKLNYYPFDRVTQLIDLEQDPDERHSCHDDPACRAVREDLHALLLDELQRQVDPLPRMISQY